MSASHFLAFCDESYLSDQYRVISCISLPAHHETDATATIQHLLTTSSLREFKWKNCKDARYRYAAEKLIDFAIEATRSIRLRVDVLIWDTQDSRHNIMGRDDNANFERMFYHLLRASIQKREPGSEWAVFCDEKDGVAWPVLHDCLQAFGRRRPVVPLSFFDGLARQRYVIRRLEEVKSHKVPLVQVADLFAGIGGFARNRYHGYKAWKEEAQVPLFSIAVHKDSSVDPASLSGGDRERFPLMDCVHERASAAKLNVSLSGQSGFRTMRASSPLNFWWYEPQHQDDKAPTKQRDLG